VIHLAGPVLTYLSELRTWCTYCDTFCRWDCTCCVQSKLAGWEELPTILIAMRDDRPVGTVPATVQLLTAEQARAEIPDAFDVDDGVGYFGELGADGNVNWVDYESGLVMVVRNAVGKVVIASNASQWHMQACGYLG
jgi:hypothetical protein